MGLILWMPVGHTGGTMKSCRNCRFKTKIHDQDGKVRCRKHKTIKDENDLCEDHKRRK